MGLTIGNNFPGFGAGTSYARDVFNLGPFKAVVRTVTMDDDYDPDVAGGEAIAPGDVGLGQIQGALVMSSNCAHSATYNSVTGIFTVHPYHIPALAGEVLDTTEVDLTDVTFIVLFIGS